MFVSLPLSHYSSEQKDVHSSMPLPMVYESVPVEPLPWEYKVLTIDLSEEALPDEIQLNEMGKRSWLLVSVVKQHVSERRELVHYYFVRQQSQ